MAEDEVEINITPAEQEEEVAPEVTPEPVKRPRGRPKGSKNKPKVVPVEQEETDTIQASNLIEMPPEPAPEKPARRRRMPSPDSEPEEPPRRRKRAPSPESSESEEPPPKRRRRAPPPRPPEPEDMATLMLRSLRESQLARANAKRQQYAAWF